MDDLKYRMTGRKELDLTYTRSQHYDDKENKTNKKKIEKKKNIQRVRQQMEGQIATNSTGEQHAISLQITMLHNLNVEESDTFLRLPMNQTSALIVLFRTSLFIKCCINKKQSTRQIHLHKQQTNSEDQLREENNSKQMR